MGCVVRLVQVADRACFPLHCLRLPDGVGGGPADGGQGDCREECLRRKGRVLQVEGVLNVDEKVGEGPCQVYKYEEQPRGLQDARGAKLVPGGPSVPVQSEEAVEE